MARVASTLPSGVRITDFISIGVLTKAFPRAVVDQVLEQTGKRSVRQRELPAHVVVYYVIALILYMQSSYREVLRCLLEGVSWLLGPEVKIKVTGKSGISQARSRIGVEPFRELHNRIVKPIATKETKGSWFKEWRLVSIDGSTLDVADQQKNEVEFGRPGASRGNSAFPQLRFVSLVENGTHILFGTEFSGIKTGEITLAKRVLLSLEKGMLCLADRNFFSFELWNLARSTGAELVWRIKKNMDLPCEKRLSDGSYLSSIYPTWKDHRKRTNGITVRVVEYKLLGMPKAEPIYRLLTTIFEESLASASEIAALYHERWEIETALDELKTHLRGAKIVLRSKTPGLVKQEIYGLLMAHYAIRGLMHEAAIKADVDADRLSFLHAVRVVRRKIPSFGFTPPSGSKSLS